MLRATGHSTVLQRGLLIDGGTYAAWAVALVFAGSLTVSDCNLYPAADLMPYKV